MPTKKEPAALLDDDPSKPPLRRGRGLRLSTEPPKQSAARRKVGAAQADPAPKQATATRPAAGRKPVPATPAAAITAAESDPAEATLAALAETQEPQRRKREFRLRRDLLKACKRIARGQNRKLTEVIEAALKEYIQRHEAAA
jgi:hypothetical protein